MIVALNFKAQTLTLLPLMFLKVKILGRWVKNIKKMSNRRNTTRHYLKKQALKMQTDNLFSRLSTVHKPDCAIFGDGPLPEPAPNPDEIARMLGSDDAALYAEQCRPVYEDLRRVVGQLAGLMILNQLTSSSDVADLKELDNCVERCKSAEDRLNALKVPSPLTGHFEQLKATHYFSCLAMETFSLLSVNGDNEEHFDTIARHVRRAYAHLRGATAEDVGLEMVDLSQSCCSCGR